MVYRQVNAVSDAVDSGRIVDRFAGPHVMCWSVNFSQVASQDRSCQSPYTASLPDTCAAPGSSDSTTTMDSLDCSHASASSVLPLRPPSCCLAPFPVAVLRRPACLMLQILLVMTTSPFLVCMSCPHGNLLLMLRLPHLQTVMMRFTFRDSTPFYSGFMQW
jgi:hypothetical protein